MGVINRDFMHDFLFTSKGKKLIENGINPADMESTAWWKKSRIVQLYPTKAEMRGLLLSVIAILHVHSKSVMLWISSFFAPFCYFKIEPSLCDIILTILIATSIFLFTDLSSLEDVTTTAFSTHWYGAVHKIHCFLRPDKSLCSVKLVIFII